MAKKLKTELEAAPQVSASDLWATQFKEPLARQRLQLDITVQKIVPPSSKTEDSPTLAPALIKTEIL